jgi:hypothetical protein
MKSLGFAVSWLAMTVVVGVLDALPSKSPEELPGAARHRPTPPPAFRR